LAEAPRRGPGPAVRKGLLALALTAGAAGVARYRAGPAADVAADAPPAERVAAALLAHTGLPVTADTLQLVPVSEAPMGPGAPVAAVFTARPAGQGAADVFRATLRLAPNGTPLVVSGVTNLTRTPDSDERLLDVVPGCLLFANVLGERPIGAVLLDFEREPAPVEAGLLVRLLAGLSSWQSYGTARSPERFDVALTVPGRTLTGRCTDAGAALQLDEHVDVVLDRAAGTLTPVAAGRLQVGGPPPLEVFTLLADALRSSEVVGTARVVALEAALFEFRDWVLRTRHGLFPTAEDRQPVAPSVRTPAARGTGWPPGPLSVPHEEAVAGEGEWTSPLASPGETPASGGEGPPVLRTFLRVDPERPYERVYLFAFDMRRLGLHFVGGTTDPRSTTGVRGRGTVRPEHRAALLATFNGGFKVDHGLFGAAEGGQIIVPPAAGLGTVALDAEGRARFGVWDLAGELPAEIDGLRQNLPPLLASGVVNPQRMHNWGQLVSRLDESQTPRSALGVTDGGILVFGWAPATSAELLGEAMRRAGVQFAIHLDMNPNHTGLELYPAGAGDAPERTHALRGAPEMDHRERRWLGVDARDFFYLTMAAYEQRPTSEPQDLGVATPEGPDAPVRLWRLDAVRPQSIPGLAEPAPVARGPGAPRVLKLPAAPVFWVDSGVRSAASDLGLVVGGRVWRAPVADVLTLTVDQDGVPRIGPWPAGGDASRFPELLQGQTILRAGTVTAALPEDADTVVAPGGGHAAPDAPHGAAHGAEAAHPAEAAPAAATRGLVALGQDSQGRLLLAAGAGTTPAGVAKALLDAGAVDALLLTGKATVETGRVRFFQMVGDKLYQSDRPMGRKEPADLRPRAGMVLVFTPRTLPPRARVVSTFRTEAK
jgi:hypothetical protein